MISNIFSFILGFFSHFYEVWFLLEKGYDVNSSIAIESMWIPYVKQVGKNAHENSTVHTCMGSISIERSVVLVYTDCNMDVEGQESKMLYLWKFIVL